MTSIAHLRSRHSQQRVDWPRRARGLIRRPAWVMVVVCGVLALADLLPLGGVVSDIGDLGHVNGTLSFVALSLGLLLRPGTPLRTAAFAVPALIGAATMWQYVAGVDLGIDQLLAREAASDGPFPGRPAATTAMGFLALGLAGLLNDIGRRTMAQAMAGTGLLIGGTAAFGYVYGVSSFASVVESPAMSPVGAVGLVVTSAMLWLAIPFGALQWLAFGRDSGARAQRKLAPLALGVLPGAAWLFIQGLERDLFGIPLGTALLTCSSALVLLVGGYHDGRSAFYSDLERDRLLDELHSVNADLEDRVKVKAAQLDRQRSKLALFEERDRIARDLHDRVIQRIFAAGLQVASLGRNARKDSEARGIDSALPAGLDQVAIELDLAIRELRNSIFELTSIGDHDDVEQVVRDIGQRAARILGFVPRVEVGGDVDGIGPELVANLASVVQEALSNVARHARASAVAIDVRGDGGELRVCVTDDGIGLPDPLPRSSGISNLLYRARQLGGTASWGNAEPHGTILTWCVPRSGQPVAEPHGYDTPVASSEIDHRAAAAVAS